MSILAISAVDFIWADYFGCFAISAAEGGVALALSSKRSAALASIFWICLSKQMAAALRRICLLRLPKSVRSPHPGPSLPSGWLQAKSRGFLATRQLPFGCCHPFSTQRNDGEAKQPRPKTVPKPLVTLLGPEKGAMVVILLEEAEKIAKRRDLRLHKVSEPDTKSGRATFKLLSHSGHLGTKSPSDNKGTDRIVKHDHKEKQVCT